MRSKGALNHVGSIPFPDRTVHVVKSSVQTIAQHAARPLPRVVSMPTMYRPNNPPARMDVSVVRVSCSVLLSAMEYQIAPRIITRPVAAATQRATLR